MKNKFKIKSLEKSVKEFLDKRKTKIESKKYYSGKWKTYYYLSPILVGFALIRLIGLILVFEELDYDNIDLLKELSYLFGAIAINRISYNIQKKPPSFDKNDYDKWYWRRGRNILFFGGLLFLVIGGNLLIRPIVESSIKSSLTIACAISLFTFIICIMLIVKKPIRILNSTILNLGNASIYLVFIFTPLIYIIYGIKTEYSIIAFIGFFLLIYASIIIFHTIKRKPEISPIRHVILNIVEPYKILNEFRSQYQKLNDQIKALKIIKKLKQKRKFGVQLALTNILSEKYANNNKNYTGYIIALLIFILGAIGEGFFQDLIYQPIKSLLCKYIESFC